MPFIQERVQDSVTPLGRDDRSVMEAQDSLIVPEHEQSIPNWNATSKRTRPAAVSHPLLRELNALLTIVIV